MGIGDAYGVIAQSMIRGIPKSSKTVCGEILFCYSGKQILWVSGKCMLKMLEEEMDSNICSDTIRWIVRGKSKVLETSE